jgi:pyruvate dehydrogenase E1 component beta subunit|tara:strand:+ start:177 stop:1256 length:1080 start_codon:yes stop_codon:yes gene_type:complete
MSNERRITYAESIHEALDQSMEECPSVFVIGEGVPDPKGIFGTTLGLKEKYGKRVLDMPISENGMTGVCIGAALTGMKPILIHQRIDFSLMAIDQLINNAAKWHYMFGGQSKVPLVIRLIIGRGWGQGAQHSQNLQALFAHIPGLKVVMPSTAYDAKGLLISSIEDNNPVVFIEHRWLHNTSGLVPTEYYKVPIGKAKIVQEGNDLTIATTSFMTIEAIRAAKFLKCAGINPEIVDLRTLKPLDEGAIIDSVKKTGRLLVLDLGYSTGGFAGEVIAGVVGKVFEKLKSAPKRITLPDIPTPTTLALTKHYYPTHVNIIKEVFRMLGHSEKKLNDFLLSNKIDGDLGSSDVPDKSFTGPF